MLTLWRYTDYKNVDWEKLKALAKEDGAEERYYHDMAGFLIRDGVTCLSFTSVTDRQKEILNAMGFFNNDDEGAVMSIPYSPGK